MSATDTTLPSAAASPAAPPPPQAHAALPPELAAQAGRNAWLWLGLAALTGLSLVGNVLLWGKLSAMQEHLAQSSVQAQGTAQEAKALAQTMSDRAESNQAKLALLDARLQEMTALNRQVEVLLQQATRSQNSNLLTDLESSLRLAEQQAQQTRNAQPLLDALEQAQNRLAQSDAANAVLLKPASSAIAQDLQQLRTANYPDINAAVAELDELMLTLDHLPLWADAADAAEKHAPAQSQGAKKSSASATAADSNSKALDAGTKNTASSTWQAWGAQLHALSQSLWQETRNLVQIERMDGANPAVLSQQEAALLREQMKLYVLSARTAILSGRLPTAGQSLAQLQNRLPQYFDQHSRSFTQVQKQLVSVRALLGAGNSSPPQAEASIAAIALLNERLSAIPVNASLPHNALLALPTSNTAAGTSHMGSTPSAGAGR